MRLTRLGTIVFALVLVYLVWRVAERHGWRVEGVTTVDVMFAIAVAMIMLLALGSDGGGPEPPGPRTRP